MKKLFYALAFILIGISVFFNVSAYAEEMGGAGGSWGDDSGFGGNGGATGGAGSGGSWDNASDGSCTLPSGASISGTSNSSNFGGNEVCGQGLAMGVYPPSSFYTGAPVSYACNVAGKSVKTTVQMVCNGQPLCEPPSVLSPDGVCVDELKCPAGYVKSGNSCIWQCPVGYKMLGGNCVKDDMPEDCDPTIQTCDENGEPVCDCCGSLQQLVNMTNTQINNDNRIISLTETSVSNQNTIISNTENINNNINNVNNNINNVNNNLTTINESIENVITTIENNKPDFDTSGIEAKLQQLIDKDMTVDGSNIEMDFTPLITKLDELNASIKANKYDDTELKAKIDELINKDLSEITDRQDEQTSLLEDIKRLLMPTNEAGDPDLNLPEVEQTTFDPWGAIKGFDINTNMINASSECPPDKTFTVMGATFSIPMTPMCTYLSYLAPIFLALAYFQGAMIILRSGD